MGTAARCALCSKIQTLALPFKPRGFRGCTLWDEWSQPGFECHGQAGREYHCRSPAKCRRRMLLRRVGDSLDRTARSLEKSEIRWISMGHEEARAFAHPDRNSDHSPTHGQGFAGATGASASAHAVSSCFSRGRLLSAVVWWDRDPFAHTA